MMNFKQHVKCIRIVIVGCTLLLSGCASIINGTTQRIKLTTPPVNGASCKLSNSEGTWHLNKTPGSVRVHRDKSNLFVICNKPGYRKASVSVPSHMSAVVAGNVVAGGFIGAGVDAVDGAAFRYPEAISIPMKRLHGHHNHHRHKH